MTLIDADEEKKERKRRRVLNRRLTLIDAEEEKRERKMGEKKMGEEDAGRSAGETSPLPNTPTLHSSPNIPDGVNR